MKQKKFRISDTLVETVTPFEGVTEGFGEDGLFDDCPICQELRRQLALGQVRPIPVDWEWEEEKAKH